MMVDCQTTVQRGHVKNLIAKWRRVVAFVGIASLGGCTSTVSIAPLPPEKYERLGATSGSACGILLLGDYVAAFIPIGLSERVQTAKAKAIANVPGATDLVDVSITERWYYWLVGSSRCVTVSGEAIKS
jgi:hypothetical protein